MSAEKNPDLMHDGVSLGEWIIKMVQAGKQDSSEFKSLMQFYGRQRFEEAYKQAKRKAGEK